MTLSSVREQLTRGEQIKKAAKQDIKPESRSSGVPERRRKEDQVR